MCELDYADKILVFNALKDYKKQGGIVINLTNDIEETLYSDKLILLSCSNSGSVSTSKTALSFGIPCFL